jgi:hypothetical protein
MSTGLAESFRSRKPLIIKHFYPLPAGACRAWGGVGMHMWVLLLLLIAYLAREPPLDCRYSWSSVLAPRTRAPPSPSETS